MRAVLNLELFGEDTRQLWKIYKGVFEVSGGDFGKAYFDKYIGPAPPRSSWVAEISGPDAKYGLKREFVKSKLDYSHANSKGSRGIFAEFLLDEGKIYEVKARTSWGRSDRYFCIVTENGDIKEIDEETACHAVGALTREERREKRYAKKLSWDKRP